MNNICLVPFIGLPASGKTTTAIELVKYSNISFICISYDLFQRKLNLNVIDYKSGLYKEFREFMLKFIDRVVTALRNDDKDFLNVRILLSEYEIEWNYQFATDSHSIICILLDDNHYYRSMRYEIYQLAKRHETGFLQIYFKSTLENSIERNRKRCFNDQVSEEVVFTMNTRLEQPNIKNHWEKFYCIINIDQNELNYQNIYQLICNRTVNPEKPNQTSEIATNIPSNKLHQIDLYLRKLISKLLKEKLTIHHPDELNEKRKHILADLRAHIIEIPLNLDEIQEYFTFNK